MYVPVTRDVPVAGEKSWAAYSPTPTVVPVIGTVSRDGQQLAALVSANATMTAQAWHDCMHNNPQWTAPPGGGEKVWRVGFYVMANDPDPLLRRARRDFPDIEDHSKGRDKARDRNRRGG